MLLQTADAQLSLLTPSPTVLPTRQLAFIVFTVSARQQKRLSHPNISYFTQGLSPLLLNHCFKGAPEHTHHSRVPNFLM
jgi:hypothetical protein